MELAPIELDDLPETSLDQPLPQWSTLQDYLEEYYLQLGTQGPGLKTYFDEFDKKLEGLRGIIIIGGEPGSGKTALALQIGFDTALDGRPIVIYSFEMPKPQLVTRFFQRVGKLSFYSMQSSIKLLEEDRQFINARVKINQAAERITIRETKDFFVKGSDGSVNAIFDFSEQIRQLNQLTEKHDGKAPLVIIDSLHEIPVDQKYSRELKQKIDYLMLNLRNMCDQTGSTFLVISHQSRSGQANGGLQSFLGSASIEYTVDMALTIVIPTAKENPNVQEGDRELVVAKNRYGPKPQALFEFNGKHMEFTLHQNNTLPNIYANEM